MNNPDGGLDEVTLLDDLVEQAEGESIAGIDPGGLHDQAHRVVACEPRQQHARRVGDGQPDVVFREEVLRCG